jgi:hypothetical protein
MHFLQVTQSTTKFPQIGMNAKKGIVHPVLFIGEWEKLYILSAETQKYLENLNIQVP